MKIKILFLILFISLIACKHSPDTTTRDIRIIWTSKPVLTNKPVIEGIRRYITRMSHWRHCDTLSLCTIMNYSNFSVTWMSPRTTEYTTGVPDGYFIIDSTVCLLYNGFESAFTRMINPPQEPFNGTIDDTDMYICYDKETGEVQFTIGPSEFIEEHDRSPRRTPPVMEGE